MNTNNNNNNNKKNRWVIKVNYCVVKTLLSLESLEGVIKRGCLTYSLFENNNGVK